MSSEIPFRLHLHYNVKFQLYKVVPPFHFSPCIRPSNFLAFFHRIMAITSISKPIKWFSSKGFKLTPPRLPSKSPPSSSSQSPRGANLSQQEELQRVFCHFDRDGDGKISSEELTCYFRSVGESISHEQARSVIQDFDDSGDCLLEFKNFVRLIEGDSEMEDVLRGAFEVFEVEKGSGCITPKGLQQMLNRMGDHKTYQECVTMIQNFDLDGNGVLDFHEFQQMMNGK